jgi:nucleoside-diphosphate-sugar epimerase
VIDAFLLAYDKGTPGDAYNIGSGSATTVNEIAERISKLMGLSPDVYRTGGKSWEGDIESTQADVSLFASFGWQPKIGIEAGLQHLYKWIQDQQ